ncbi:TetR/AcrR family transcriptional regulator [Allobranchiibius sp. GilTou38]|uniref:TetR/AcrR family transcriptional regulator n=1 Tax=Allobranchiibius sp. GilTou38 TaxID=2815210 RepID=UPI001AA12868|nr:TetR/AcrR family transcriptional regulator [Allobranchiibius sp. GilTou38]MBO1767785.1 TetR/AcrR family transcriptional regulator [Allobranchiibius sp. GilTou38]
MTRSRMHRVDGRDARWTAHREERRMQLTESALRAIRRHGAGVGMDEIAAEAGTSKTVIYRHLGDRLGLYLAVCASVDRLILADFSAALDRTDAARRPSSVDPRSVLIAAIDSYLALVENDPEVYRFVTRPPQVQVPRDSDPVIGLSASIAERLSDLLAANLREGGRDEALAPILAAGLVGFVRESADSWVTDPQRVPRAEIVEQLAEFAAVGLNGFIENHQRES